MTHPTISKTAAPMANSTAPDFFDRFAGRRTWRRGGHGFVFDGNNGVFPAVRTRHELAQNLISAPPGFHKFSGVKFNRAAAVLALAFSNHS